MNYFHVLEITAHWAAILTSVVAVWAYGLYRYELRQKRLRLEKYLKAEKEAGTDLGMRTVMHLVAALGMTDTEVMDAAFRSRHIIRRVTPDLMGAASKLLLEYSAKKRN